MIAKSQGETVAPSTMDHAYLGPSYSDEQIHAAIVRDKLRFGQMHLI